MTKKRAQAWAEHKGESIWEVRLPLVSIGCCPARKGSGHPTTCPDDHVLLLFVRIEKCINFSVHSFWPLKRQCLRRFLGFFLKQKNCTLDSEVEIPEGTLKLCNLMPCDGFYFYLVLDTLNFSKKVPIPAGRH